jgi:hypothetical protein
MLDVVLRFAAFWAEGRTGNHYPSKRKEEEHRVWPWALTRKRTHPSR